MKALAVAEAVGEVTDVKCVGRAVRRKPQVARAAKASRRAPLVKLADKIYNLRDIIANPPTDWSLARRREHFDWARRVVERVRGASARLERRFDQVYGRRP